MTEQAPEGTSSAHITVDVAEQVAEGIAVTADFPSLDGGPSDTFTYNLTVTNNTPTTQTFEFAATGPNGWQVDASPTAEARATTVSIDGGGTSTVKVTATPPATVDAGAYDLGVTVTSDSGATGTIKLTANVTGRAQLAVATSDERLDMSGPSNSARTETLVVTNSGTAPLENVSFRSSPPKGWTVAFEPSTIDAVPAGQSAQVVATITPTKDAVAGDYAVALTASSGSLDQSLALRYSVTTSWTWGLLGALLIVLAIGALTVGYRRFGRR
ncbi:MAG: NEW3 domain-containing protein [Ilumatobacteraceae bacterium]